MDLYIYYRVRCEDAERFLVRARRMRDMLARDTGIAVWLKRRPEASEGRHTWMEVYSGVPEHFESTLAAALKEAGLIELIDGDRHHEYFMDVDTCA